MNIIWDELIDLDLDSVINDFKIPTIEKRDKYQQNNVDYTKVKSVEKLNDKLEPIMTKSVTSYNIMWSTKSTRKHKIWKNDATLHVMGNKAEVRDDEDKVIAKLNDFSKYNTGLIDGQIISIGTKDLLIVAKM